jgi:hypothetical protein
MQYETPPTTDDEAVVESEELDLDLVQADLDAVQRALERLGE